MKDLIGRLSKVEAEIEAIEDEIAARYDPHSDDNIGIPLYHVISSIDETVGRLILKGYRNGEITFNDDRPSSPTAADPCVNESAQSV